MIHVMTEYQLDTCSIMKTGAAVSALFSSLWGFGGLHEACYSIAFGLEKGVQKHN